MAMAASGLDLQRCAMCLSCGSRCSSSSSNSIRGFDLSALPGVGVPEVSLKKRFGKKKRVIRSLYSSLVESFGRSQHTYSRDLNHDSFIKVDYSGVLPSPQQQKQGGVAANEVEVQDCSQEPEASSVGDNGHAEKLADVEHKNMNMKRSVKARAPSMSISQGFSSHVTRSMSHSVGAVGHPLTMTKLPGPMGFVMAFVVAALGLKTAATKQGLLLSTPQRVCEKCEGYGVQECHVCQGRGFLTWEGKLRHTDPCPLCFGSCLKKCPSCGGMKMKKGLPPDILSKFQLRAGVNRIRR